MRTAIVLIEPEGDPLAHARSFSELLYAKVQDRIAGEGSSASVRVKVAGMTDSAVSSWEITVNRGRAEGWTVVTALVPPPPPRLSATRRAGWHLSILPRVTKFVFTSATLERRRVNGFGPKLRALLRPVWPGLGQIARVPVLYVYSFLYGFFAFRAFRYMGTLAATVAIVFAIALAVIAGWGEDTLTRGNHTIYDLALRLSGTKDSPGPPADYVYQVLAAGIVTALLTVLYTAVSLFQRLARGFTSRPSDWERSSELSLLLSPTCQAEFEASLAVKLEEVEKQFKPERIYVLASGPHALLSYAGLSRASGNAARTDVTLLTWNATLTEGASYGLEKVWMLIPRRDWPRFQVQAPKELMWWHLNARMNVVDGLHSSFTGPGMETLAEFRQPMLQSPPGLLFTNRGTVARIMGQIMLDLKAV